MSSNARLLDRAGIAERIKRPGDRRDFYQISQDGRSRVFRSYLERMTELLARLELGREAVPKGQRLVRRRFTAMIDDVSAMLAVMRERAGS